MVSGVTDRPRVRVPYRKAMASALPMPEAETPYHAASILAKDLSTAPTVRMSPDAALLNDLDTIVSRTDDLVRNNGVASGAIRTLVDNVIGPRLICKPMPDRIALGKDPQWVFDWSRKVESLWATFSETVWFDAGSRHTFHSATRLAYRSIISSGEIVALPLWLKDRGSRWNTAIQLVNPARLSTPTLMTAQELKGKIRGGVEIDQYGAPVAYHIRKTHPIDFSGSLGLAIANLGEWERIDAYLNFGRIRVMHVYDQEDVGQTRGKPAFASVARQFKMLDHYMREELRLAVLNSLIFAALETPLDQASIVELFSSSDDPMGAYQQALAQWRVPMQGGAIIPMPPGTTVKPFLPQRQTNGLDSFASVMLRQIGTGLNMPYELVFRDFSKTNYSSARAALLEAWRYFLSCRQFIVDAWAAPIFELWFEEAVNRGDIPDCTPDQFYGNRIAWTRCKWIGAGRGWIDPLKEARAAQFRMQTHVTTLADEAAEQGHDWRDMMEQQAMENSLADELGTPRPHVVTVPNGTANAGAADVAQAAQDAADQAAEDAAAEGANPNG